MTSRRTATCIAALVAAFGTAACWLRPPMLLYIDGQSPAERHDRRERVIAEMRALIRDEKRMNTGASTEGDVQAPAPTQGVQVGGAGDPRALSDAISTCHPVTSESPPPAWREFPYLTYRWLWATDHYRVNGGRGPTIEYRVHWFTIVLTQGLVLSLASGLAVAGLRRAHRSG